MRKLFSKIAFTAALMLALTFTFSCSGGMSNGEDDGTSSPSGNGGGGSGIVNANNEAWVLCGEKPGDCGGIIFKQNGEFIEVSLDGGNWCMKYVLTYSISGNQICVMNGCVSYSISGDKLTVNDGTHNETYTRTSGVYLSGNCSD